MRSSCLKLSKAGGLARPPAFDSFKHHDLTAKHCYFRCSRSPDVYGINIFDKDNQATKLKPPF